ncbi:AppF ABC-type oligopeptide transport system, ATPase component [Rhabdaerophilaceae bacterium]
MATLLEGRELTRAYRLPRLSIFGPRPQMVAVNAISLKVTKGETLGIVGESGSGKSTLARLLMALERPDSGSLHWLDEDITGLADHDLRSRRRHVQMVFQDPFGSLNPRMRILQSIAEPLDVSEPELPADARRARVEEILRRVGLNADAIERYPHQFSGGQRQRIAIARALITGPKVLVADEPVSALDVSIQAQILNLLSDMRAEFDLSMVFISHDLGIVRYLADRVMVMHHGRVVEEGACEAVFSAPSHAYTRKLIAAMPTLGGLR